MHSRFPMFEKWMQKEEAWLRKEAEMGGRGGGGRWCVFPIKHLICVLWRKSTWGGRSWSQPRIWSWMFSAHYSFPSCPLLAWPYFSFRYLYFSKELLKTKKLLKLRMTEEISATITCKRGDPWTEFLCFSNFTQCWQTKAPKATSSADTISLEDKGR